MNVGVKKEIKKPLFDFFVNGMFVAMGAELLEFQAGCCVATVFCRGVARNPGRSFIGVSATLRAFQRDNNSNTFSHDVVNLRLQI